MVVSWLILALAPLSQAVRPTDPIDVLSSTSHSNVSKHDVDPQFESKPSGTKEDMPPMHVTMFSNSALLALSADKNATTQSKVEARSPDETNYEAKQDAIQAKEEKKEERLEGSGVEKGGEMNNEGVKVNDPWMDYLFNILDDDTGGDISKKEWDKNVKGQWKDLMWSVLDANGDGKIDLAELKSQWNAAITKTFETMGGGKSTISKEGIQKFGAQGFEKDAAEKMAGDGQMTCKTPCLDRAAFDEFIFTIMFFNGIAPGNGGSIDYETLKAKTGTGTEGPLKDLKLKFGDQDMFKEKFGADGMQPKELLDFLNENNAFTSNNPDLNKNEADTLKAKNEDDADNDAEGKNKCDRARATLAFAVVVLTMACALQ